MTNCLKVNEARDMFLYVAEKLIESKPVLTEIDSQIGDGDHGVGMAVGFAAAADRLNGQEFESINDLFKTIGAAMLKSMGGASGVIFGTMFMGGVKDLPALGVLDTKALAEIFTNSLNAVKARGKANLGDKTMIDSLEPATRSLCRRAEAGDSLAECLRQAEESARDGVENTKNCVARVGRAKSLGERAIGFQDPGATSVWLIFKAMREWLEAYEQAGAGE
jgi:dihydroxyacetone kinase phosphoprotein-dependent L subunit